MKSPPWRSVIGGIIAAVTLTALILFVLIYARTGVLHGDKFRLYVAVPDATGLLDGSDVWLNGQRVGTVATIDFAPVSVPPEVRVVVGVDVLRSMQSHIRLDSRVALRSGGTIIGAPVVYLEAGSLASRAVVPGDTLRGEGKSDFEVAASRVTESLEEVPALMADARLIMARTKTAGGRLSTIATADHGRGSFMQQAGSMMSKLSSGGGSAGRIMRDVEIRRRMTRSMARVDSLRTLLASRANEFGRFRRDTSLLVTVKDLQAEVEIVRAMATSPDGTIGRAVADSALRRSIDSAYVELTALFADIKKNPLRYARVF